MNENTIQTVDPAETCECNPEWNSAPGCGDGDDCRCSIVTPPEKTKHISDKESS